MLCAHVELLRLLCVRLALDRVDQLSATIFDFSRQPFEPPSKRVINCRIICCYGLRLVDDVRNNVGKRGSSYELPVRKNSERSIGGLCRKVNFYELVTLNRS
jgi:hypothetical protein